MTGDAKQFFVDSYQPCFPSSRITVPCLPMLAMMLTLYSNRLSQEKFTFLKFECAFLTTIVAKQVQQSSSNVFCVMTVSMRRVSHQPFDS